jgi:hypothetical protein
MFETEVSAKTGFEAMGRSIRRINTPKLAIFTALAQAKYASTNDLFAIKKTGINNERNLQLLRQKFTRMIREAWASKRRRLDGLDDGSNGPSLCFGRFTFDVKLTNLRNVSPLQQTRLKGQTSRLSS